MLRLISNFLFYVLLFLLPLLDCLAISEDTLSRPLPAHAHNDYLHERALLDAMEHGFRSIEADVFSQGDSLYVAHDRKDIRAGRTLRSLYLEPLMEYFSDGEKSLYNKDHPLILLVDIKDHGLGTYKLLDRILQDYREILCRVSGEAYAGSSVMVVISGNRPMEYMMNQMQRFAFVDGRMQDLSEKHPPELMPLVSDRWSKHFSWRGKGDMPEKERKQLGLFVQEAHENGQMIRFWATPDIPGKGREAVWTELLNAGADLINTDDLGGLRKFLLAR